MKTIVRVSLVYHPVIKAGVVVSLDTEPGFMETLFVYFIREESNEQRLPNHTKTRILSLVCEIHSKSCLISSDCPASLLTEFALTTQPKFKTPILSFHPTISLIHSLTRAHTHTYAQAHSLLL